MELQGMVVGKVTGANAYLNGQKLIGKIEEVELPDIKQKMEDYKALGYAGEFSIPVGFEKMSAKIKWKNFYIKEFLQTANPRQPQMLMIRANQAENIHGAQLVNKNITITLNGIFKNFPLGKMAQHEVSGLETEMEIYAINQMIDGTLILTVDVFANIYMVGGADLLAEFKANT